MIKKIIKGMILLTGFAVLIYNLLKIYDDYKIQKVLNYADQLYKEND